MTDWQVGDLAVCVESLPCADCGLVTDELRVGNVYRVGGVDESYGGLWLLLPEIAPTDHEHWDSAPWYLHDQFRKITADEQEACEPEFVTLLKRSKVTA